MVQVVLYSADPDVNKAWHDKGNLNPAKWKLAHSPESPKSK